MLIGARAAVTVDIVEIDLLCAVADVAPPFPLRVPATGGNVRERRRVLRAAGERLAARGLADERGPLGVAEAFTHLLRRGGLTMDLVLSTGDDVLGAVLLADRGVAVLTTQELTGAGAVCMAELSLDDAVDQLIDLVPVREAALTAPFQLPRGALDQVHAALRARAGRPLAQQEWEALLADAGIDDRLGRRLITHLQPVRGNGQLGLAVRGGYADQWQREGAELRWLDTERGRFQLVDADDGAWMSVNPLHANEFAASIRRMAAVLPN